jgi:hypothetical protein
VLFSLCVSQASHNDQASYAHYSISREIEEILRVREVKENVEMFYCFSAS